MTPVHSVEITGWRSGLRKISMTRLVQAHAGLRLGAAKAVTDRVLDGEAVSVEVPGPEAAEAFAAALRAVGAVAAARPAEPGAPAR